MLHHLIKFEICMILHSLSYLAYSINLTMFSGQNKDKGWSRANKM